ncbi:hypothetical protein ERJ75_001036500 [Trypanosoma vivax]|nr:hypothetical protein ERJ75_001036500 [Trypanosoma vivax]
MTWASKGAHAWTKPNPQQASTRGVKAGSTVGIWEHIDKAAHKISNHLDLISWNLDSNNETRLNLEAWRFVCEDSNRGNTPNPDFNKQESAELRNRAAQNCRKIKKGIAATSDIAQEKAEENGRTTATYAGGAERSQKQ